MFPADFAYARAESVPHALDLLAQAQADGEEAKLLAGGQSLLPMMKLRLATPQLLIDLGGIAGLAGVTPATPGIAIGALTTYRALQQDQSLATAIPAMADALAVLADPQVRARGTIGGAVAHGDPAADLPAVLLALDAIVEITARSGTRTAKLDDFLQGVYATDLAEDEILTTITLPAPPPPPTWAEVTFDSLFQGQWRHWHSTGTGSAYEKFAHPASHLPLAGVCAVVTVKEARITEAKIAVTGISARPYRASSAERMLHAAPATDDSITAAAALVAEHVRPLGDQHASGPYRVHLAEVLTRRALRRALTLASAA
jgi:carbon-monoxide dehydrogenase medium subunit